LNQKLNEIRSAINNDRYKFTKSKEEALKAFTFRCHEEQEIHKKVMLQKYISP